MQKRNIFKNIVFVYLFLLVGVLMYLLRDVWTQKEAVSTVPLLNTSSLDRAGKGLQERDYETQFSEVDLDEFSFGDEDPFR